MSEKETMEEAEVARRLERFATDEYAYARVVERDIKKALGHVEAGRYSAAAGCLRDALGGIAEAEKARAESALLSELAKYL